MVWKQTQLLYTHKTGIFSRASSNRFLRQYLGVPLVHPQGAVPILYYAVPWKSLT